MSSKGGRSRKSDDTGSMVWWDLQTVPPPQNHQLTDHLLASHRATRTGLFSLAPPLKLRAHGTEPLADAAYDCIVKSQLLLQQSISPGSEQGSTRCWKAMVVDMLLWATDHKGDMVIISKVFDRSMADVIHQLHIRNYNITVTTSFPPKDMTSLQRCAPPLNCRLLRQIFPLNSDPLPSTADANTTEESLRVRQSILLSEIARPKISTQVLQYGPLTMAEVRTWLQELVACGRADTGINLSLLGRDFEEHKGKKLNYKSLHCPTLMVLLSKFENLVRLERKDSCVILFPSIMQSRPDMIVPVNPPFLQPQRPITCSPGVSMRPPACTWLPRIVQVPGQISIRKDNPNAVPVPKFSTAVNTTAKGPKNSASPTSDHKLFPNRLPDGESCFECGELNLLPKVEQTTTTPSNALAAACEPESSRISSSRADPVSIASTAPPATSEIKIKVAGGEIPLLNEDTVVPAFTTASPSFGTSVPGFGAAKVLQASGGEDAKQGDAGSGQKFDFYSLKVVQEREAIKRTFESVNKRLQEEFKKRKLTQQQPVSGASNSIAK